MDAKEAASQVAVRDSEPWRVEKNAFGSYDIVCGGETIACDVAREHAERIVAAVNGRADSYSRAPMTHSPLPWRVATIHRTGCPGVKDANGDVVLSDSYGDDARLIVHRVNVHDELVSALSATVRLYDGVRDAVGPSVAEKLRAADAALATAEGLRSTNGAQESVGSGEAGRVRG